MPTSYKHLTIVERKLTDQYWNKDKLSMRKIASRLNVSPNTISLELKRNSDRGALNLFNNADRLQITPLCSNKRLYRAESAQTHSEERRKNNPKHQRISYGNELFRIIDRELRNGEKPDTIAGGIKLDFPDRTDLFVCQETIYQSIYAHTEWGWWEYLKKARKKRSTRKSKREVLKNRKNISERSKAANERTEIGHMEGDTVVGSKTQSGLYIRKLTENHVYIWLSRCLTERVLKQQKR
jgi:IS30 family transposase